MNPNNFGDPLTFSLMPSWGWRVVLWFPSSQNLSYGFVYDQIPKKNQIAFPSALTVFSTNNQMLACSQQILHYTCWTSNVLLPLWVCRHEHLPQSTRSESLWLCRLNNLQHAVWSICKCITVCQTILCKLHRHIIWVQCMVHSVS